MNEENFSSSLESTTTLNEPNSSQSGEDDLQLHWQGVVKRRSFLKGISIAGATLAGGAMVEKLSAQTTRSSRLLSKVRLRLGQQVSAFVTHTVLLPR